MAVSVSTSQPKHTKPSWLKVSVPGGERYNWILKRARSLGLHTVCEEARCPNIGECWNGGTATFMLMGDSCTRGCRFCSVASSRCPPPLDPAEPLNIAETIRALELDYVVITSVNRDDLPDQGAQHFAQTIRRCQLASPQLLIEILTPDFQGRLADLETVLKAHPTVFAHNIETIERLTPVVRDHRATFAQSLEILTHAKKLYPKLKTKSSIMLGLGETEAETLEAMETLRSIEVDFLTIGQYLQPTKRKLKVHSFVHPDQFKSLQEKGLQMGFAYVASGPLVRSSYRAAEFYLLQQLRETTPPLKN